jgi:hypothetical protein
MKWIHTINTRRIILTRIGLAFVDVCFTSITFVAKVTVASRGKLSWKNEIEKFTFSIRVFLKRVDYNSPLTQVPPLRQGDGAQYCIFVWHNAPVNPGAQLHWNPLSVWLQAPPFRHGLDMHGSTLNWQCEPANCAGQLHVYPLVTSTHLPEFWHGLLLHLWTAISQWAPVKSWLWERKSNQLIKIWSQLASYSNLL